MAAFDAKAFSLTYRKLKHNILYVPKNITVYLYPSSVSHGGVSVPKGKPDHNLGAERGSCSNLEGRFLHESYVSEHGSGRFCRVTAEH